MVKIDNLTSNQTLMEHGRLAANPWTRLRGLIGVHQLESGDGLLIKPCHGVHCMFMSIPIDVIYVNKQHQVVALDKAMQPWAVGKIYRDSHYVVEVPIGTIERTQTQVGDQLKFTVG